MIETKIRKEQEIREIFSYLSRSRGQTSQFIMAFLNRNYFVSATTVYRILSKKSEESPIQPEEASIIFKAVMNNEYHDL